MKVTVLMAAFNASKYINATIDSILDQSFEDFEFLIIEDGSQDDTWDRILGYCDTRIRAIRNEENIGLIASLNKGLKLAKGEYIARMDADDICLKDRLKLQVEYLDKNPEIGLCGTWFERFTDHSAEIIRVPQQHNDIICHLVFDNAFLHSTVMYRNTMIGKDNLQYDPDFPYAEDYELWVRMSQYTQVRNLPVVTVKYRFHAENISTTARDKQIKTADKIRLLHARHLGIDDGEFDAQLHNMLAKCDYYLDSSKLTAAEEHLLKISSTFKKIAPSDFKPLSEALALRWYNACGRCASGGISILTRATRSPLFSLMPAKYKLLLLIRCILRRPVPAAVSA